MAAIDLFELGLRGLTEQERQLVASFIATTKEDLLAARSEDASLRLAKDFARTVHDLLLQVRR